MSGTATYKCPLCGADITIDTDPVPETVVCNVCEKEFSIPRTVVFSGDVFAGDI